MATITQPRPSTDLVVSSRKVHDPLSKLRGYIRTYVVAEVVTYLVIGLALFFWIGLALDYGSFLLGIDWARDLPRPLRAIVPALGLLLIGFFVEVRKILWGPTDDKQPQKQARPSLAAEALLMVGVFLLLGLLGLGLVILLRNTRANSPWRIVLAILAGVVFMANWAMLAWLRDLGAPALNTILAVLIVVGVFTGLIIARRFMYEFSDVSLALVLERRFPKLLGDRLITAVELSDPKIAARYGYSAAMVEKTIHDAAEAVGKLDVRQVFDWGRLRRRIVAALVLTVGVYAVALGSLAVVTVIRNADETSRAEADKREPNLMPVGWQQASDLHDAAAIWTERNVVMENERWPTRSLVRLTNFPDSGELKKGRGSDGGKEITRVNLYARAVQYAFHDRDAPESWRPLMVDDLSKLPLESTAVIERVAQHWKPLDPEAGWMVDDLNLSLHREGSVALLDEATLKEVQALIDQIDELTTRTSMSRTVRRLTVPKQVTLEYRSEDGLTKASATMQTHPNNEYSVELPLKDSVRFYLRAEDFISDTFKITLVPPPRLARLNSVESRPAYLYHLYTGKARILPRSTASLVGLMAPLNPVLGAAGAFPPERPFDDDDRFFLGDKKQLGKPRMISLEGVKPRISVPAATDLLLLCETDKDLRPDSIVLSGGGALILEGVKPKVTGERTFEITIPDVRSDFDFRLEFRDTEGALGVQELQVGIDEDAPPTIEQFTPTVVREVSGKFRVTPSAVIPFTYFVKDPKFGLSTLDFVYTIKESPSKSDQDRRAMRAAGAIGLALAGPESMANAYVYNLAVPATLRGAEEVIEGRQPVEHFQAQMDALRKNHNWEDALRMMREPMAFDRFPHMITNYNVADLRDQDEYLRDPRHEKSIEDSKPLKGMDVSLIEHRDERGFSVGLKARGLDIQRRYDMIVYLEARDNNVARTTRGRHESQPISFEIVSEVELLFDIAVEEQRLYDELAKAQEDLRRGFELVQAVKFDIPSAVPARGVNFDSFSVRVEEVQKVLNESRRVAVKVQSDYEKVLREMRTNRIEDRERVQRTKDQIVLRLLKIINGDARVRVGDKEVPVGFPIASDGLRYLRDAVDNTKKSDAERLVDSRREADAAEKDLDRLMTALGGVLEDMAGIVKLADILKGLNTIKDREHESHERIKKRKQEIDEEILRSLGGDPKKP